MSAYLAALPIISAVALTLGYLDAHADRERALLLRQLAAESEQNLRRSAEWGAALIAVANGGAVKIGDNLIVQCFPVRVPE
jgi:hypothetical protein